MKNRRCPAHNCCIDYNCGACETCEIGNHILKLHRKIDRLKKKNEQLEAEKREAIERLDTLLHPNF